MEILDNLHIVGGNNYTQVTEINHISALKPSEPDSEGAGLMGNPQSLEYVRRASAAADCECNVARLNKIYQLLRKDIFITRIVCLSRH